MCEKIEWRQLPADPYILNRVRIFRLYPETIIGWEVSSHGEVRYKEEIIKQFKLNKRYLYIRTYKVEFAVHIIVALTFIGSRPTEEHEVNHIDDNKINNCVKNLEWLTHLENMRRAIATGAHRPGWHYDHTGENNSTAILTENDVREIRSIYRKYKLTQKMLAEKYNVSPGCIADIVSNRNWRHLL